VNLPFCWNRPGRNSTGIDQNLVEIELRVRQ
jgi:hypothetical protein